MTQTHIDFSNNINPDTSPFIGNGSVGITILSGVSMLDIATMHNFERSWAYMPSSQVYGSWEFGFKVSWVLGSAEFWFIANSRDASLDSYGVILDNDGGIYLMKKDSQGTKTLLEAAWVPDSNMHILKIIRETTGIFTLKLDDATIGTFDEMNTVYSNKNIIQTSDYMMLTLNSGIYTPHLYLNYIDLVSVPAPYFGMVIEVPYGKNFFVDSLELMLGINVLTDIIVDGIPQHINDGMINADRHLDFKKYYGQPINVTHTLEARTEQPPTKPYNLVARGILIDAVL